MKRLSALSLILLPWAFALACSGSVDEPPGDSGDGDGDDPSLSLEEAVVGRSFVLESAEGYTLVAETALYLSFHPGEISFSAGCNGYFGEMSFDGDVLVVDEVASTGIDCDAELQDQDSWFAEFFTSRPTVVLDGDRLTLTTDEATFVFIDNDVANPPPPLLGTVFEITALIDGEFALGGFEVAPTVTFEEDGTVRVFSGCNSGEGTFEHTEDTITIVEGIGYTEIGCPSSEAADVEAHVQAVFGPGEITYSFNGQSLVIDRGDIGVRASQQQ